MKKFLFSVVALVAFSMSASATQQVVVTDCATQYRIPNDTPQEVACWLVDLFSWIDC